jgi:hypothetical protein
MEPKTMRNDPRAVSMVLYGLPREPAVNEALFRELAESVHSVLGPDWRVACHKFDQRQDCVAHGGLLYTQGGRKS